MCGFPGDNVPGSAGLGFNPPVNMTPGMSHGYYPTDAHLISTPNLSSGQNGHTGHAQSSSSTSQANGFGSNSNSPVKRRNFNAHGGVSITTSDSSRGFGGGAGLVSDLNYTATKNLCDLERQPD